MDFLIQRGLNDFLGGEFTNSTVDHPCIKIRGKDCPNVKWCDKEVEERRGDAVPASLALQT